MIFLNKEDIYKYDIKQNGIIIIIPCFNNPSYCQLMVEQLEKYLLKNILFIDNSSSSEEMKNFLHKMSEKYSVLITDNFGPRFCYEENSFFNWLPSEFILTDPDIGFNSELPLDFVDNFRFVSQKFELFKVGFALDIDLEIPNFLGSENYVQGTGLCAYEWEKKFWTKPIGYINESIIYEADIDTTFCYINKKFFKGDFFKPAARLAGKFTSQHFGWYKNPPIPDEEFRLYIKMCKASKKVWTHIKM